MNTQYLQHHLERRISHFAHECVREGFEDHGLICEIFAREDLNDEIRLNYIGRIEGELSRRGCLHQEGSDISYLANSPKESQRAQSQKRWDELHEIAVDLVDQSSSHRAVPLQRFLELVSTLDNPAALADSEY